MEGTGQKALKLHADTAVEADVQGMFRACIKELGKVDICVPNSGL
jgi:hypothetical protein